MEAKHYRIEDERHQRFVDEIRDIKDGPAIITLSGPVGAIWEMSPEGHPAMTPLIAEVIDIGSFPDHVDDDEARHVEMAERLILEFARNLSDQDSVVIYEFIISAPYIEESDDAGMKLEPLRKVTIRGSVIEGQRMIGENQHVAEEGVEFYDESTPAFF